MSSVQDGPPAVKYGSHSTTTHAAACRTPPLCSMRLTRPHPREASIFHVTNARFWEAALLPIAVVVVIAFSSCMDLWIGQFISLSWWYAANLYSMTYALRVLHPQTPSNTPWYRLSPFCGTCALWLWSFGIAAVEMVVYHLLGHPKAAHSLGTTLYSICGCLWLHAVVAPWHCIPASWRPRKLARYMSENRLLELPRHRQGSGTPVVLGSTAAAVASLTSNDDLMPPQPPSPSMEHGRPRRTSSSFAGGGGAATATCAGQVALAVGAYSLLVVWHCAFGLKVQGLEEALAGGGRAGAAWKKPPAAAAALAKGSTEAPAADAREDGGQRAEAAAAEASAAEGSATTPVGSAQPKTRKVPKTTAGTVDPVASMVVTSLQQPDAALEEKHPWSKSTAVLRLRARSSSDLGKSAPVKTVPAQRYGSEAVSTGSVPSSRNLSYVSSRGTEPALLLRPRTYNSSHTMRRPLLQSLNLSKIASAASTAWTPSRGRHLSSPSQGDEPPTPHTTQRPPHRARQRYQRQTFPPSERKHRHPPRTEQPRTLEMEQGSKHHQQSHEVVQALRTKAWGGVLVFGFLAMLLLWLVDRGKPFEFSAAYLVCFNVICLRVPDLLGHVVITLLGDVRLYSSPAMATTAISFSYMGAMQAYIMILRWVCTNMSSQHLFPRFHFVAQMYYYLFWYMMLMVVSPAGVEDMNFWLMVAMLNGNYLVSNVGVLHQLYYALRCRMPPPDPPLKILFESKLAVQDQLADVVSLLIVPAIATSFHICTSLSVTDYPGGVLISLWQRFGALLLARLLTGLLTEEIFRRRVELLYKADAMELQLLPLDTSQNRLRYLNDICVGPKLAHESMRNIERCELYFTAVAVICTFAVFQQGDVPSRYAFIAFGA